MSKSYILITAFSLLYGSLVIASGQSMNDLNMVAKNLQKNYQQTQAALSLQATLAVARVQNQQVHLPVGAPMTQQSAVAMHNAQVAAQVLLYKNK